MSNNFLTGNNPPGFNNQAGITVYGNNKPVSFLSRDNLFNIATIAVFVATIIFNRIIGLEIFVWVIAPVTGVNTAYKMYINDFLRNFIIASVPIGTFFILAMLNKVTFKDGKFFNKSGQDLSDRLPSKFGKWLLFSVIGVSFCMINIRLSDLSEDMFDDNFFHMLFLISTSISLLYFVILNCPISILINKEVLTRSEELFGASAGNYTPSSTGSIKPIGISTHRPNTSSSSTSRNYYSDPSYRSMSGNIYNSNKR